MGREKLLEIVRDFFKLCFKPMPSDGVIEAFDAAQLGDFKASLFSILASTQTLGPMFAELQERSVTCLNCVGEYIDAVTETIDKVDQQIKARALVPTAPPQPPGPAVLPPKFALILSRVSKCLSAVAGSPHYCKGADVDNVRSVCSFLDTLTVNAPGLPSSAAADVLSAADAIMSLPTELQLLDDEDDPDSHASKRVRLASGPPIADADPYGPPPGPTDPCPVPLAAPPPGPDSVARTASPSLSLPPSEARKRVTGKKAPVKCNQWGTMCQVFDMSPRAEGSHNAFENSVAEVAFIDPAFENDAANEVIADASGVSPPTGDGILSESISSGDSMDEDTLAASADVVRPVPTVKAAASLKPPSKAPKLPPAVGHLTPQQKQNLRKKMRKQARQAAAA